VSFNAFHFPIADSAYDPENTFTFGGSIKAIWVNLDLDPSPTARSHFQGVLLGAILYARQ
jgi:hypothetical protein